jgi:IS605 OrfB family transposase
MEAVKTLKLRIKDKHDSVLRAMAREVNFVWNYCNETSSKAIRDRYKFLSGFDLQKLTAGYSKCEGVGVGSATVQLVCEEYALRRKQFKKVRLNWRVSNPKSARRSLGWVPFKVGGVKYKAGQVSFLGHRFSLWDSYGLSKYELKAGSFAQDARGRWYLNVCVKVQPQMSEGTEVIGIDLGLKTAAVCSDGTELASGTYRQHEAALAKAQRAHKKNSVRAIHAKIANTRKDAMHKFSTGLVARSGAIFVGNVSAGAMVKTKMAKSALDAGWSMMKTMLEYKSHQAGVVFAEVNEAYTTQTCSSCGIIPGSSPKGRAGLRMRRWTCCECGAEHDRDVNAARNIARVGRHALGEGAPA